MYGWVDFRLTLFRISWWDR